MNKKLKMSLRLILFATMLLCIPSISVHASEEICSFAEENDKEARAPKYEWAYKVINGKLYKRLFNIKSGEYVGDWILVQ